MCIYIYIYIHTYMCMYIYIYRERERYTHIQYICIYRSLGVVSDKIAQLNATPYKWEILLLRRRRRLLLLIIITIIIIIIITIIIGDVRGKVKVVANPGNRDRVRGTWHVVRRRPWRVARGARSMAPCVARDR